MSKSRCAEPAKSTRRRSPDPRVVRLAAFVNPIPKSANVNCSCDSKSRGVKPESWRSRQKSLRGFAKCAPAAAEIRPGLIPQKITRSPGARTSGTAESGCFGLCDGVRITGVECFLEPPSQDFALQKDTVSRAPRLEAHDAHRAVPVAVAPGVALRLRQRAQPSHGYTVGSVPDAPVERAKPHGAGLRSRKSSVDLAISGTTRTVVGADSRAVGLVAIQLFVELGSAFDLLLRSRNEDRFRVEIHVTNDTCRQQNLPAEDPRSGVDDQV